MRARLIFALDVASAPEAVEFVRLLRHEVGMFKVGKQLFMRSGPQVVSQIRKLGGEVFLDLKFHDIPRTVAKAAAEATRLGVRMLDLHASGSFEMMRQTITEVGKVCRIEGMPKPKLLAVTVLTSLDRDDLKRVGVMSGVEHQVVRLARLSLQAGMDGVVASPHEIGRIRKECGRNFLIVTPGVRPVDRSRDDQKRVMTPEAAFRAGADYLVVGNPIRDAADPVAAARDIVTAMERGFLTSGHRGRLFAARGGS
ncbi:MAG: orotidine 5'-phosphate decarboxylase [Acidobacteria bacterium RBG_16_68_9]|nr:MAG: orotidine 5'-phosphate decarboxylase [Acidobacteria bacterium RBG_16_68_9]